MTEVHDMDRRERDRLPPRTWGGQPGDEIETPAPPTPTRAAKAVAAGVVDELAARREKLESNARDIREAALASEDGSAKDGLLWALLDLQNSEKSLDLLDAAAQVRRDIRLEQAAAKAVVGELQAQLEEARARLDGYDRQLAEIEERIVRPVCARLGQGDTRVVKTGVVRVAIHKTPARVVISDPDVVPLLPDEMRRVKYEPDKSAIKAALEAGATFPGIELQHNTRVDWR